MAKTSPPHLALHTLIGALSYWGSWVRTMLFGFVFLSTQFTASLQSGGAFEYYLVQFLYVVGIFVVFDAGYVTIARALPFRHENYDKALFFILLSLYAALMILPYFVILPSAFLLNAKLFLLLPLFTVAVRLVLGMLYGHRTR